MSISHACHEAPPLLGRRGHRPDRRRTRHPSPHRGHHLGRRGDPRDVLLRSRARDLARHQHRVRQRPLRPRQPERAVGPGADARTCMNFMKDNGTILSNTHTPMIAHTADDSLSIYTGLYGDRHGQPLSNSYKTLQPRRHHRPGRVVRVLDQPGRRHRGPPRAGHDTTPSMVYSDTVPASGPPNRQTPAPWVPFTRAGCDVGDFSTANMVARERQRRPADALRRRLARGRSSSTPTPTASRTPRSPTTSARPCTARRAPRSCADAQAVKFGQTHADAVGRHRLAAHRAGRLPRLPGALRRQVRRAAARRRHAEPDPQRLPGHRRRTATWSTSTATRSTEPFSRTARLPRVQPDRVPDARRCWPTCRSPASRSPTATSPTCTSGRPAPAAARPRPPPRTGKPIGPGDKCYADNGNGLRRGVQDVLRAPRRGRDQRVQHAVRDQRRGERPVRRRQRRAARLTPTPAGCDGVTVFCTYPAGTIGELQANIKGLLSTTASAGTTYDVEPQGASIYAHGQPVPTTRRSASWSGTPRAMTRRQPLQRGDGEQIVKYQAGAVEERILHMQTADPLRTPSYTMFPVPDYFFSTTGRRTCRSTRLRLQPRLLLAEHRRHVVVVRGSGRGRARDRRADAGAEQRGAGPELDEHRARGHRRRGTWVEEVDLRPTMLWLLGLRDDYTSRRQRRSRRCSPTRRRR